jgi:hypothetical protein
MHYMKFNDSPRSVKCSTAPSPPQHRGFSCYRLLRQLALHQRLTCLKSDRMKRMGPRFICGGMS